MDQAFQTRIAALVFMSAGFSRAKSPLTCQSCSTEDDPNGQRQIGAFKKRLTTLGWIEGNNITVDVRFAGADPMRARELATELLRQRPDLMVSNSNLVTAILQKSLILSAVALSTSWQNRAAILPALPSSSSPWEANG
jgi:hypothetical protein